MFKIGCDPEFFITDGDKIRSAIPYVKGTKAKPQYLSSGAFIMQDNVTIEFGIPPMIYEEEWIANLTNAYQEVEDYLPEPFKLQCVASAVLEPQELQHPVAQQFGCHPDHNAWTVAMNPRPHVPLSGLRSAGGHIHFDFSDLKKVINSPMGRIIAVRAFDGFHGNVSAMLDTGPASKARKQLYGKPGAYRPTEYGIEYRVLSNFWMQSPLYMRLMYNLTADVYRNLDSNFLELARILGHRGAEIQNNITYSQERYTNIFIKKDMYHFMSEKSRNLYEQAIEEKKNNE